MIRKKFVCDAGWSGSVASFLLFTLLIVLPVLWCCGYAAAYSVGAIGLLSDGITHKHWNNVVFQYASLRSLAFTTAVASFVSMVSLGLGMLFTVLMPRAGRSRIGITVVIIALGTPASVLAFVLLQWMNQGGLLSRIALHLGLVDSPSGFPSWTNDAYSVGMILGLILATLPIAWMYYTQLWIALKIANRRSLAMSLGATKFQADRLVVFPVMVRHSSNLFGMLLLVNLGAFEIPLILGSQSMPMLSVYTYRKSGVIDLAQRPEAFAIATIYFVLAACLSYRIVRSVEKNVVS